MHFLGGSYNNYEITVSGVNLTRITQEVTQLVTDASVAEKVAQRQYDYDEQLVSRLSNKSPESLADKNML